MNFESLVSHENTNLIYSKINKRFIFKNFKNEMEFQREISNFEKLTALNSNEEPEQFFRCEKLQSMIAISKSFLDKSTNVQKPQNDTILDNITNIFKSNNQKQQFKYQNNQATKNSIVITRDDGIQIVIWRKYYNLLSNLFLKNPPIIAQYTSDGDNFKNVFSDFEIVQFLNKAWYEIFKTANLGIYYRNKLKSSIKPDNIFEYLNYRVVKEKYNDYSVPQKQGFWRDEFLVRFRPNMFRNTSASIDISRENEGKVFDIRTFYFSNDKIQEPKYVNLRYRSSQEFLQNDIYSGSSREVYIWHWQLYHIALDWYSNLDRLIFEENNHYVQIELDSDNSESFNSDIPNNLLINSLKKFYVENYKFIGEKIMVLMGLELTDYFNVIREKISITKNDSLNVLWKDDKSIGYSYIEDPKSTYVTIAPNFEDGKIETDEDENYELIMFQHTLSEGFKFLILIPNSDRTDNMLFVYYHSLVKGSNFYYIPSCNSVDSLSDVSMYELSENSDKNDILQMIGALDECQVFFDDKGIGYISEKLRREDKAPDIDYIEYSGIKFKVINRHNAAKILENAKDFYNNNIFDVFKDVGLFYNRENAYFLVADEDVHISHLELIHESAELLDIYVLGFIFMGDLTVDNYISTFDTDNSPTLIVFGNTFCTNVNLFANIFYFGGNLICQSLIGRNKNGEIYVRGNCKSSLLYSDDMRIHLNLDNYADVYYSTNQPSISNWFTLNNGSDGTSESFENFFESTHFLSDIAHDIYVTTGENRRQKLIDNYFDIAIKPGYSLIDKEKLELGFYQNFKSDLVAMIGHMNQGSAFKELKSLTKTVFEDFRWYQFMSYLDADEKEIYQLIYKNVAFRIRIRAVHNSFNAESVLYVEYLNDDGAVVYNWSGTPDDSFPFSDMAKYAIYRLYEEMEEITLWKPTDENKA